LTTYFIYRKHFFVGI